MDKYGWESLYNELPKPKLKFFSRQQSDKDYLTWIRCNDETLRSFSYLWLYDLISLEPEIRRAVAEAKSLKGVSSTDHPGARHQPFRYHADNACYRIFAALDKVGQLLNTYLSLSINEEDYKKVNFNRIMGSILNNTDLKVIPELLYFAKIKNSLWYNSLSEYRHSLTHRLNPICEDQESYKILLKTASRFLKFKPIVYTIDQLDNLITDGHNNVVVTIDQCEELLNKVPCRVCCGEDHAI